MGTYKKINTVPRSSENSLPLRNVNISFHPRRRFYFPPAKIRTVTRRRRRRLNVAGKGSKKKEKEESGTSTVADVDSPVGWFSTERSNPKFKQNCRRLIFKTGFSFEYPERRVR